jgi:hypothetical protein
VTNQVVPAGATHFTRETAAVMAAPAESHELPRNERDYWIRFTVPERSSVEPSLNWTNLAVEFEFEVFQESTGRLLIASSRGQTNVPRKLMRPLNLEPGTYSIHVHREWGDGAVGFTVEVPRTAQAQTTAPARTTPRGNR